VSHELRVERLIDASPGEVFDVFVDADAQKEWYRDPEHPGGIVETECDARVGGCGPPRGDPTRTSCTARRACSGWSIGLGVSS
jgi:uncharacterized protein YndB with AHSA1/START domain